MIEINDNNFKIKFDGEKHQIEANILINSLIHTTSIIQEINNFSDSGKKIEIKINALEKGSFLIHIELLETAIQSLKNLLSNENIQYAAAIVGSLVGLIELKKHLKGRKAKKIEKEKSRVKIENEDGQVIYIENLTYTIYENSPIVKDALSQSFESLNNDPSITGFEITDKHEKPLIRIDRKDFESMSQKSEEISDDERIITEAATLNIVRLSFEGNLKWDFYYRGNKISAKIIDSAFYELIDKGEAFAKGDILEVELQINQKFEEAVNTFINKSYQVNKIIRHLPRNEQGKLDFPKA